MEKERMKRKGASDRMIKLMLACHILSMYTI